MILRIGPITIMDSKTRAAYAHLANMAYGLHQAVWYGDLTEPATHELIRYRDGLLSDALSHTPPEDIQSSE